MNNNQAPLSSTDTNSTSNSSAETSNADSMAKVEPINPRAATKTNENMLKNVRKFTPQSTTESGKNVYSEEDEEKIVAQFNELLDQGYNLTMTKKALAVHHNINTGTLDALRKSDEGHDEHAAESLSTHLSDLEPSDAEYFTIVQKKLDDINDELKAFEQKVADAKELLANEDKLRAEIEAKKESYLPPAFKEIMNKK
ncbi:hypothetical protein [Psychrobacter piechaudii]|uniref:Uncharacterized protein n=1 Tax=Psychrobacter piechaudii TaxID=1945521 RepID=A0A1R4GQN1_9GAMM|nr:hypothetical protein [Psychrobacter piechaudii]SJM70481.1 hypothetical protein A1232T_00999 [Psychrobacter piechaudii]